MFFAPFQEGQIPDYLVYGLIIQVLTVVTGLKTNYNSIKPKQSFRVLYGCVGGGNFHDPGGGRYRYALYRNARKTRLVKAHPNGVEV